ncbi:pyridoxal phosphate-dependent aminotransferase [Streptomyces microflavus]|uniref:pyridoxal phosphate-dependent aminotransferase n=1 Tax=Streptomyces microflavus TaxID=1919 RepID=UPI00365A0C6C
MTVGISAAGRRVLALPRRAATASAEEGIISLDRGDPGCATPDILIRAMTQAMRGGHTHYGNLDGDPELRTHIASSGPLRSSPVSPEHVVITPGSTAGLSSVLMALVDPGDRVVILDPTYAAYAEQIALVGGVPVRIPFQPDGHLDLAAVHHACSAGARLLILCHPASPTGIVFTRDELTALGDVLAGSDTYLLADEAYADVVYDGRPFTSTLAVPNLRPRLIMSRTLSKSYAMTGWRIGYLVLPPALADPVNLVHRTYNLVANAAVQRAALTALKAGPELLTPMLSTYVEHRDAVMAWMRKTGLLTAPTPEATFYVFARYNHPMSSVDLVHHLTSYGVRVRAGSYDGPSGENHLRICFAAPAPVLTEGLRRIAKGLSAL